MRTASPSMGVYPPIFVSDAAPASSPCTCASLRMATRVVNRRYDQALAPAGITTTAYSILSRLDREGPQAIGVLAARMALDRTTLSRELRPLVDDGLLTVRPDRMDTRRRVIEPTRAGRKKLERALPLWRQAQDELAQGFGVERTSRLMDELRALVGAD
jgi:DNA-binding MarR family transcriptional regulator